MFSSSFEKFVPEPIDQPKIETSNQFKTETICQPDTEMNERIKQCSNIMTGDGCDYYKNFITGELVYFSYFQPCWKEPKNAKKLEHLLNKEQ